MFGVAHIRKAINLDNAILALILGFGLGCRAPSAVHGPVPPLVALEASHDLDGAPIGVDRANATIIFVFASWCPHCHHELEVLAALRRSHPSIRVLGVSYRGHEEYDGRGNSQMLRAYVTAHAEWLRVVAADDPLFELLGRPAKVPTLLVFDRRGALVATFDRRERAMPEGQELSDLLHRIGS